MALGLSEQSVRNDLSLDAGRFVLNPQWMGGKQERVLRKGLVTVEYDNGEQSSIAVDNGFPFPTGSDFDRVPVFAYGAFRLFLKSDKRSRPSSAIRSLFEANYVLPNPETWLLSLAGKPLFSEVARALKFILAIDQEVDVIEVSKDRQQCFLVVTTPRPGAEPLVVRTPISAVSSGFRAILAMACDIMRGLASNSDRFAASLARTRAVVLIDEVEAHLHPRWKMQIIGGLRRALPEVTFIVTTHDPLCLRGLASEEVRVFHRVQTAPGDRSDLPTYVEQLQELPAMGALTIEQLLTSDFFRMHSTDAPELDASMAEAGDLLALEASGGLDGRKAETLARIRRTVGQQIGDALPIGSTEIERLVQGAIEDYLRKRRQTSIAGLQALREETRANIVAVLSGL